MRQVSTMTELKLLPNDRQQRDALNQWENREKSQTRFLGTQAFSGPSPSKMSPVMCAQVSSQEIITVFSSLKDKSLKFYTFYILFDQQLCVLLYYLPFVVKLIKILFIHIFTFSSKLNSSIKCLSIIAKKQYLKIWMYVCLCVCYGFWCW